MTIQTVSNKYGVAKWIVDPVIGRGTHTTIQAAVTASAAGDDIVITPGTYTENISGFPGSLNITTFTGNNGIASVVIVGKITYNVTGILTLSNLRLQTNSDFFLESSGTLSSSVTLTNCDLRCTNNTGVSFTTSNANANIILINCTGNVTTTGITYFSKTSPGFLFFKDCLLNNTGLSTTASTSSAGNLVLRYSFLGFPVTTSSTCTYTGEYSSIQNPATNVTSLIHNSTAVNCLSNSCFYSSGSASAVSLGVGATLIMTNNIINSSNTNAITETGVATLTYSPIVFQSTTGAINVTTQNKLEFGPSIVAASSFSGGINQIVSQNKSNTASSQAAIKAVVAGSTADDAYYQSTVNGVTTWTWGIDNSVSGDPFVLAASAALGTTDVLSITTGGAASFVLGNLDVTRSSSGASVVCTVSNTSNTASSDSTIKSVVAGTSGGDAVYQSLVIGATAWTWGIDNSVTSPTADPFVLSQGSALGTNNVMSVATTGEINYPLQPSFSAYLTTTATNATGDGTAATIVFNTELFDQNADYANGTGTFTAPVTGRYQFNVGVTLTGIGVGHTSAILTLSTSNRIWQLAALNPATISIGGAIEMAGSVLVDMDAADTATVVITVTGSTKTVSVASQATNPNTFFSGFLQA